MAKVDSIRAQERRSKTTFHLDSPFTTTAWPEVSVEQQDTILELLCNLLSPIGHHRRHHTNPSRGKRQKRAAKNAARTRTRSASSPPPAPAPASTPAEPPIASHVTLGFNATIRHLQGLSHLSAPAAPQASSSNNDATSPKDLPSPSNQPGGYQHMAAVFVPRAALPGPLLSQLPLLTVTASMAFPMQPPTLLVSLPKPCSTGSGTNTRDRISNALALPRVGFIGLLSDAPGAGPLMEYVRSTVTPVSVPWLQEATAARYLPVKIGAVEAPVGMLPRSNKRPLVEEEAKAKAKAKKAA